MHITTRQKQRTLIHLSKTDIEGAFLAQVIVYTQRFDGSVMNQTVAVETLSQSQLFELQQKAQILRAHNIFIIDKTVEVLETSTTDTATQAANIKPETAYLIGFSYIPFQTKTESTFEYIPSPYSSKIKIQDQFFATQKTRGPNKN